MENYFEKGIKMGWNSTYWNGKENRAKTAMMHHQKMQKVYKKEIDRSVKGSEIWDDNRVKLSDINRSPQKCDNEVIIDNIDTVSAVMKYGKDFHTAVLNFASYKNAGGGFLAGSSAQEESLCHGSFLYEVLSDNRLSDYYAYNNLHKNRALYTNRAIYSPEIMFFKDDKSILADVITCAAPNNTAFTEYNPNEDPNTNYKALKSRIEFIGDIVRYHADKELETVILGAFGCGVFGQEPAAVAQLLKEEFSTIPVRVIYAIIDRGGHSKEGSYTIFKRVIKGE